MTYLPYSEKKGKYLCQQITVIFGHCVSVSCIKGTKTYHLFSRAFTVNVIMTHNMHCPISDIKVFPARPCLKLYTFLKEQV